MDLAWLLNQKKGTLGLAGKGTFELGSYNSIEFFDENPQFSYSALWTLSCLKLENL